MSDEQRGTEVEPAEAEAPTLDPETRARRDAALALVQQYGDPILRTKARPVDRFDAALHAEIERMARIMNDSLGIGLAATQVGVAHRLLVYRVEPDSPVQPLVNPEIEWSSRDEEIMEEGCLSLPSVHVDVERPLHVLVRAQDAHGDAITVEASGLEARVIQHELDHLDGVLMLARTDPEQRRAAVRALRLAEPYAPPWPEEDEEAG